MARRRTNTLDEQEVNQNMEHLSNENPDVQEKLLDELTNDTQDNQDTPGSNEPDEMNNLSNEEEKSNQEQPVDTDFQIGDRVKLGRIKNDTMGRRIHNGIKNYVYTIRSIRPDGVACIECLTHVFNVKLKDLNKI